MMHGPINIRYANSGIGRSTILKYYMIILNIRKRTNMSFFFCTLKPGWKPRKSNCCGVDKKMILKCILKMRIFMIRTEFSLLMLGFNGELFDYSDFPGSLKCVG